MNNKSDLNLTEIPEKVSIKKIISIILLVLSIINIVAIVPIIFKFSVLLVIFGGLAEDTNDIVIIIYGSLSYIISSVFALILFIKNVKNNGNGILKSIFSVVILFIILYFVFRLIGFVK